WDSYRRLIAMFAETVLGASPEPFNEAFEAIKRDRGISADVDLDVTALKELVDTYKGIVQRECDREFPQHPREQLDLAIEAVFGSWNSERAQLYRRRERIPHDLGTAEIGRASCRERG